MFDDDACYEKMSIPCQIIYMKMALECVCLRCNRSQKRSVCMFAFESTRAPVQTAYKSRFMLHRNLYTTKDEKFTHKHTPIQTDSKESQQTRKTTQMFNNNKIIIFIIPGWTDRAYKNPVNQCEACARENASKRWLHDRISRSISKRKPENKNSMPNVFFCSVF